MLGWLLSVVVVLLLWLFSFWRILLAPRLSSKAMVLRSGKVLDKCRVLLVVAHPDDESMFFCPTINYLISRADNIFILCMSIGNADGLGSIRREELYKACAILKVPFDHIHVIDNPYLQDGFRNAWGSDLLAVIVKEEIAEHDIDMVISFDKFGISGHPNHRDLHFGIRELLPFIRQKNIEAWELITTNIIRKFSGPLDVWLSMLNAKLDPNCRIWCLLNADPWRSIDAMSKHASQWVWFRKLFVVFSSYTYVNMLRRMDMDN